MSVDIGALLKILPVFLSGLLSPGPDFMIVSTMALARGQADGIKAAAGVASIISFYTLVCLLGLAVLFEAHIWLMSAVRLLGGFYLLYLGGSLWRASFTTMTPEDMPTRTRMGAYKAGAVT